MTVSVSSFRNHYPEFSSSVDYPIGQISYYLSLSDKLINQARWKSLYDLGVELFIAHNIVLEARAQKEAATGSIPGITTGPISAKSVDKVSVNYDVADAIQKDAGHWNLTIYGTRFVRLMRMFGAGPVQVGVGCVPPLNGPAWPGPQNQTSF